MKPYSFLKIDKFLKKNWFKTVRQTWSHVVYTFEDKVVVVPKHWNKDIPWPTVSSILKQAWLYEKYKKWF